MKWLDEKIEPEDADLSQRLRDFDKLVREDKKKEKTAKE